MKFRDMTDSRFLPVWIEGANESRLGYVLELSYPKSVVYVRDGGTFEVLNSKLHFLLNDTHWKMRNYVYEQYQLENSMCLAITRTRRVAA